jgi:phosphoribosylamine---glycine ligase
VTLGNGGTEGLARALPLKPGEIQALAGWAEEEGVDLTVVGPEGPLALGIVDHFSARGLSVFGPTRAAAELESSKAFAKALMQRHGVPTAAFHTFSDLPSARRHLQETGAPVVVKASGLAAGKGAVVCLELAEALEAVEDMLGRGAFGEAGNEVVIEEFMRGEELSLFALTDGETVLPMLPAQDHKRVGEGETGPNTGGMGAYAPVSIATPELLERVQREILLPTVRGMQEEGRAFRGLLYAGLMLTDDGPRVVEFNCRFGDPETQVVLPMLESSLLEPLLAIARGESIEGMRLSWRPGAAATTVVASGGYPGEYRTELPVSIDPSLATARDVMVFHAGTKAEEGRLVTSGGRVVAVTALADSVGEAAARCREAAEGVRFEGAFYRRDIGWREIQRT